MARERQVTRTINVTTATAICMNLEDMTHEEKKLHITGDVPSAEKILKDLRKQYDTDTFKVVAIKELSTTEQLYGMSEIEFLQYAKLLDNETRKPIEQ